MQTIILAAGLGTRLRPLTYKKPKPLIEINGKPFLWYLLKNLNSAGHRSLIIIAHYKIEQIKTFVDKYEKENDCEIKVIDQGEVLGTGHALQSAKDLAEKNFIVVMSDNLYSCIDLKNIAKEDDFCYVGAIKNETPERYGNLVFENEYLKEIVEKPKIAISSYINTGLYKFTYEIFNALSKIKPSQRGEYELTDAISILCKERKVKIVKLKDYWLDLGCLEDIKKIENALKSKFF
ncbi:MAG: sugar phosphate nucleotidyltransferase [Candidatus Nanoarchaeia archaeon]